MGSNTCMNESCQATTSSQWKQSWRLRSGRFATLCHKCGYAYEKSIFCETFHSEESGWRECRICRKILHCGCVASVHLYDYLEVGGIACVSCAKLLETNSARQTEIPPDTPNDQFVARTCTSNAQSIVAENRIERGMFSTEKLMRLTNAIGVNKMTSSARPHDTVHETAELSNHVGTPSTHSSSSAFYKADNSLLRIGVTNLCESLVRPSLNFSFATALGGSGSSSPISQQTKTSSRHGQMICHVSPKPPKPNPLGVPETSRGSSSQTRVPRHPSNGRGRNQLLPRYWPRITDQELQQISGDLKSNIVPLFEKILSASDAGRIGRLVLPKACAEAYFPTINQSEGIPIRIQDIKGKEWTFQFRFWPNNNSRMYVLEGITPCIQNMQLQAGDTVIFSRRDPEGQLVIGCRKATNNGGRQDSQRAADSHGDASSSGAADAQPSSEKKARKIKNKRPLTGNDDSSELKVTWEEAQELFRPSPLAKPTVVMVEDHEFEEFEEPPVFGKRAVFISGPSGEQEQQAAQCDGCSKWRRLPVDALVSANWTCSENVWDSHRCSCSAPEDVNPKDLDVVHKDNKQRKISESRKPGEGEPSGLDALANAAVLGETGEFSGATTRHPRHRRGCTCIVCIQPPSGKGKHEPSCKCNVCSTVRRRFKTLMMRRKKRQLEHEAQETKHEPDVENDKEEIAQETSDKEQALDLNYDLSATFPSDKENAADEDGEVNQENRQT